ncbi:MAG: PstS family phosphate ABC transporter substrate-binding protein [Cytophagaceae bacterium]
MKFNTKSLLSATLFATVFFSCNTQKDEVKVDGSSTVYPITEAIAEEFRTENPRVKVTIGVSGTGGGFKKFIRKEIDIAEASRPIKSSEDSAAQANGVEYIELPVAYDGLAVVVHPENTWVDFLTVAELKKIWEPAAQGKIVRWNQIRAEWPDEEIHLFGAGTESGTFDYFTEAIVGESKASRGDYTASEDDNVLVQGVSTDKNALGYFGVAYYTENKGKMKIVPIDDEKDENGKGPVVASDETVKDGTYQPLSRPLFIYVTKAAADNNPSTDKFVKFYLDNGDKLVAEAKYIPLSKEVYDLAKKRYEARTTGSLFKGKKTTVGIKLEEVLK